MNGVSVIKSGKGGVLGHRGQFKRRSDADGFEIVFYFPSIVVSYFPPQDWQLRLSDLQRPIKSLF